MRFALWLLLVGCAGDGANAGEGRFAFGWQVTDNGQPVTCAAAGIATVQLITDNGTTTTEEFLCTDGAATSGPREVGLHAITVTGRDDTAVVIATASDEEAILGGQIVELGVFPLEIAAAVCDSSSCPTGCCSDTGACVEPQTDAACGLGGVACVDCATVGQVCNTNDGLCIE